MARDEELGVQGRAKRARTAAVGQAYKDALEWRRQAKANLEAQALPPQEHAAAAKALLVEFADRLRRGAKSARAKNTAGNVLMREIREELRKEKEK